MAVNPLAIGGGVVAAAAVVGGGLYAGGVFGGGKDVKTPPPTGRTIHWQPLSEDSGYKTGDTITTDYQGKYSQTYSKYLVGKDDKNTAWWNETFKKEFKDKTPTLKDKFKELLAEGKVGTDLRDLCDSAYKAKKDEGSPSIKATVATESTTEFEEGNIWKFCSYGGTKIKTIEEAQTEEASYTDGTSFGKTHKGKLVSAIDAGSDWFWDLKEKEFFEAKTDPTEENRNSSEFKKLWNSKKAEYPKNKTAKLVKAKCAAAYNTAVSSSETESTTYTKKDVGKFCTLTGAAITA